MSSINLAPLERSIQAALFGDLLDLYLADTAKRVTDYTVRGYGHNLNHFRHWWSDHCRSYGCNLSKSCLEDFAAHLVGKKLSYTTRKNIHRRLRQVLRWAFRGGYIDIDCTHWIPSAVGDPPVRKVASLDALRKLLHAAQRRNLPERDTAIIAILIGTGIRRAECSTLNIQEVELHSDGSGTATVRGKRTRSNPSGMRQIAIDRHTGRYLRDHIDVSNVIVGPLFVSAHHGTRLTPMGVYEIVKAIIEDAGVGHEVQGCHDLRRAYATYCARGARSEVEADLLRRQLGHASYSQTAEYSLLDAEDIRAGLISPLALL